jgi:hypothetical protein
MCHQTNKDMVAVIQAEDDMMDLNPELKLKRADGSRRKQKNRGFQATTEQNRGLHSKAGGPEGARRSTSRPKIEALREKRGGNAGGGYRTRSSGRRRPVAALDEGVDGAGAVPHDWRPARGGRRQRLKKRKGPGGEEALAVAGGRGRFEFQPQLHWSRATGRKGRGRGRGGRNQLRVCDAGEEEEDGDGGDCRLALLAILSSGAMQATPPFRLLVSLVSRLTQTQVYHRGRTKKKKEKGKQERVLSFLFFCRTQDK